MPRGPKGEKRPADVNVRAVMIGKIATGGIEDVTTNDGKNAAAVRWCLSLNFNASRTGLE
jgi:hypothetical protein